MALYYSVPAGRDTVTDAFPRLAVGLMLFAAVVAWQTSRIVDAELPELRAVQALSVIIPLFLVAFATLYLSLSHTAAANFSEGLDHTKALYFTVTVFSTVGFGDITPRTDPARIMVSLQMLLDLVILGVVVRLLFNAAKTGLARSDEEPGDSS
jgi:voltage-gated potassium channel